MMILLLCCSLNEKNRFWKLSIYTSFKILNEEFAKASYHNPRDKDTGIVGAWNGIDKHQPSNLIIYFQL